MFRDCLEYQKRSSRPLFSLKEGEEFVTSKEFKYPNQKAKIFAKGVFPAGFYEAQVVRILYDHNKEFEVIDCTHESFLVKPAQ